MDEVNLIRNRTFNDELRSLVNKVSSHEKKPPEKAGKQTRKELIKSFHKLFYELKYLDDYNIIESDFNPFLVDGYSDFNAGVYIGEYLKKAGFSEFAVFEYQIENECFEVSITSFNEKTASSMVIGFADNLFQNIISAENGFLLNREEIKIDKFLARKFLQPVENNESAGLYFISFSFLNGKVQSRFCSQNSTPICTPILMIKLNAGTGSGDLMKIRMDLEKNLSLPSFIYSDMATDQLVWPSFQNLLYYIDYFQFFFTLRGGGSAYIINTNKFIHREILVSMKYLYSKFYKTLCNESVIFRISVNRIMIFTLNSMIPVLDKIMNEWNILYNNAFITETKTIQEIEESDLILKDFFA